MTDLFEMFDNEAPIETRSSQMNPGDVKTELNMIIQRYGLKAPDSLLEELTALHFDPPPWQPWTK